MIDYLRCINLIMRENHMNNNTPVNESEYIDEDYEEIADSENETDLVTKVNSPINILLIILIVIVLIAIILCLLLL